MENGQKLVLTKSYRLYERIRFVLVATTVFLTQLCKMPLASTSSSVRYHKTPMASEQKGLKIGLEKAGNKVRVRFFVGNTA